MLPGDFCRRKEGKGEILEEQAEYSEVREAATGKLERKQSGEVAGHFFGLGGQDREDSREH